MDHQITEKTMPILLVEDEEAHALLVQWIFDEDKEGNGWRVDHVDTIKSARRWVEDHLGQEFLVISDYRLPDGTGLDLTEGATRPEEMRYPLIIITGVGSEKLAVQSLKSGAMDYVVKGDDMKGLPQVARGVMKEWDRIKEHRQAERSLIEYIGGLEESSADPEEFMDKIAQYLETTLTQDQEANRQLIESLRKNATTQGHEGSPSSQPTTNDALDLLSKDGLEGAMMMVDLELSRDPESWEAWGARADILYLQQRHFEALAASNEALGRNSQNALAWNTKGNVLYRLGRYDEAVECYSRAIEISPLFPKSWYNKKLALEVQLKNSMKKMSFRAPKEKNASGEKRLKDDLRPDKDRGDGTLRASIGKIR